jgi:hypothetical protein
MLGLKAVCPPGTDCVPTQTQQAATLMHELGHTLGMHHGGLDDVNNKPNYVSIMNYSFAFTGLVVSKNGKDRIPAQLDYSRWGTGTLGVLDEAFLNEKVGFGVRSESVKKYVTTYSCRKKGKVVTVSHWLRVRPVDFNCNGKANETSIASPINLSAPFVVGYEMRPHDNWGEIRMAAGAMVGKKDIFTTESPRSRVSRAMPRKRSRSVRTDAWPTRNQMLASARVLVNDAVAPKVTVKMKFIKARKRRPARVIITVMASDNRALDSVSLQVDKASPVQLRAKARSRKLTKSYVLKLRKGRHTVRIVALDSIGNSSRVLRRKVKGPSR